MKNVSNFYTKVAQGCLALVVLVLLASSTTFAQQPQTLASNVTSSKTSATAAPSLPPKETWRSFPDKTTYITANGKILKVGDQLKLSLPSPDDKKHYLYIMADMLGSAVASYASKGYLDGGLYTNQSFTITKVISQKPIFIGPKVAYVIIDVNQNSYRVDIESAVAAKEVDTN